MLAVEQRVTAREQARVERPEVRRLGDRHHQVAPQEPDRVLHRPLLVPGVGVAEADREAVVLPERGEQRALADHPGQPPPRLRGVVEDEHRGHAPDVLEHGEHRLAEALRPLRHRAARPAGVGVRERDDELVDALLDAADDRGRDAVVALRGAGGPRELQEPLRRGGRAGLPPLPDEALHGRERAPEALLADQAVEHPAGGVALLRRRGEVGGEPPADEVRVRLHGGALPGAPDRRLRRKRR